MNTIELEMLRSAPAEAFYIPGGRISLHGGVVSAPAARQKPAAPAPVTFRPKPAAPATPAAATPAAAQPVTRTWRDEFGNSAKTYKAWLAAEAAGKARIFGRPG